MLSTLRVAGVRCGARHQARSAHGTLATGPWPARLSPAAHLPRRWLFIARQWPAPKLRSFPVLVPRGARGFCSSGGSGSGQKKAPPKGFENFYRDTKPKAPAEGQGTKPNGSAAEGSTGPKGSTAEAEGFKRPKDCTAEAEGPNAPKESAVEAEGTKNEPKAETRARVEGAESEAQEPPGGRGNKNRSSGTAAKDGDGRHKSPFGETDRRTLFLGAGVAALMVYYLQYTSRSTGEVTIQEMIKNYLMKGDVDRIEIVNRTFCRVHLRPEARRGGGSGSDADRTLTIQLGTPETFETRLEQTQTELGLSPLDHVPIQYVNETEFMQDIFPHVPSLLLLIPLLFLFRAMWGGMGAGGPGSGGPGGGRNIFSIGRAFPQGAKDLKSKVKFADVAGLEQAKAEVVEFVDFLKNPAKYEKMGAKIPKGGLLVGPPGTGKTLLAKAVAGEADCPFYSMSGSDFIEMFVGVGPARVRDLFQQARSSAPSIIFIDEIDAVGRKRGKGGFSGGGNDERENTLNQMLVEMDGFTPSTGIVVLAGTNRADILDPALTRPGRFDRQIGISKPDLTEREAIFMVHLKPVTLAPGLPMDGVAKRMASLTPGFAGSDIANVCNESAIFAARRNSSAVEMIDFERACERVLGGLAKTNSMMTKEEKKAVAIHESGHAIAGWFLEHADPLLKVSIVPRSGGALGFAQYLPDEISLYSKEAMLDKIAVALGGRAAEEMFVGRISTGAADDLDKVTKMAYSMVGVYGMTPELGLLSYPQNNASEQFYKPYSDETGEIIDREARSIIEQQYVRVMGLLKDKADLLRSLSDKLDEKETLVYNDLLEVLGARPYGIKDAYSAFVQAGANPFTVDLHGAAATEDDAAAGLGDAAEATSKVAKEEMEGPTRSEGLKE